MTTEKTNNSIKMELDFHKLIYENKMYSVYEVRALHFGRNAHGYDVPQATIEKALPFFYNLPMYGILNRKKTDFEEHYRGPKDEAHDVDDIRVFGIIPESSKVELQEENGKTFIAFEVIVYKTLLPHITQILMNREFSVKLSIEFLIAEAHKDAANYIVVDQLIPQAITALGNGIPEGIKGSSMKLARFKKDEVIEDKCNTLYLCFNSQKKYYLPENVLNNMKEGLELREKHNRGGNKRACVIAEDAVQYGFIFEDELNLIKEYFSINPYQAPGNIVTNKQILHKLYGGEEIMSVTNSESAESINLLKEGGQKVDDKQVDDSAEKVENKEIYVDTQETITKEVHVYDPEDGKSADIVETVTRHDGEIIHVDEPENEIAENTEIQVAAEDPEHKEEDKKPVPEKTVENAIDENDPTQAGCSEGCKAKMAELNSQLGEKDVVISELQTSCNALTEKCMALETQFQGQQDSYNSAIIELKAYQRKEEKDKSIAFIERFSHCYEETFKEDLIMQAETLSYVEIERQVQGKVMDFAIGKKS